MTSFATKSLSLFTTVFGLGLSVAQGQTLFTPNGTVGDSGNANVGIGTNSPQYKLEIGNFSTNSASVVVGVNNFLGFRRHDGSVVYGLGHDATDGVFRIGASPGVAPAAGTEIDINSGGHRISFSQGGSERLRIAHGGNVGVGTSSPRSRLDIGESIGAGRGARFGDYFEINEREHVNNAVSLGWNAYIAGDNGTYAPTYAGPGASGMVLVMDSGGSANLDFWGKQWPGSYDPAALGTFTHVMRLGTNGNVGIGTTNPTHKLAVNGTIKAKEVIVETTGWSDYVFADDYTLAPLAEVEAHIKEHKHLPGIPSATQVAEQGVSVGDMQATLLAKIEELTLHVIAQEKRLAAVEAENARLKSQLR